jgi:ABC-2 type transport system ATP-binding protein
MRTERQRQEQRTATGAQAAIRVRALERVYQPKRQATPVHALRGIDLDVPRGSLFGILGPNGAGKTTLVRVLTTLLVPTRGTASVEGFDVVGQATEVRRRVGFVFGGERGTYDRLSALDNLRFAAELYRIPKRAQQRRFGEVLEQVGLTDRAKDRVETYSRGMRQRLHIARALLHEPDVLLLDEPSSGLDPVAARALRALVTGLVEQGKTVLLTTHYMFEADELCETVAVLCGGRIVAQGTPSSIKSGVSVGEVFEIETFGATDDSLARVRGLPGVEATEVDVRGQVGVLTVRTCEGATTRLEDVTAALADVRTGAAVRREPTLEDAYVALVEQHGQ